MSRIQAGSVELTRRPVGLEEVVSRALASLGALSEDVRVEVPEDLPLALADAGLLERALANLIANAVAWSPSPQSVCVSAQLRPPDLELRVADRGPGIPRASREKMFQPFQRLGDQGHTGVGLGLAIARGFVEAMGGEVLIDDTPGGGATLRILVAVAQP